MVMREEMIKKKAQERVLAYSWGKEVEFRTAFANRHKPDKMDEEGFPNYNLIKAGKMLTDLRVAREIRSGYTCEL